MGRPRKQEVPRNIAGRIRSEALEHFGRDGFEGASLSKIAAAVGVTRTTLLYHYESKEKLYNASVQDAFARIVSMVQASMLDGGSFSKRLRRMVETFLSEVEANPPLAKLMIREVIDERDTGCHLISEQGLPILSMVEDFFVEEARVSPSRRPLLREVLLLVTTSVMLKSASGSLRTVFWGERSRTADLTHIILEALLLAPETSTENATSARASLAASGRKRKPRRDVVKP